MVPNRRHSGQKANAVSICFEFSGELKFDVLITHKRFLKTEEGRKERALRKTSLFVKRAANFAGSFLVEFAMFLFS